MLLHTFSIANIRRRRNSRGSYTLHPLEPNVERELPLPDPPEEISTPVGGTYWHFEEVHDNNTVAHNYTHVADTSVCLLHKGINTIHESWSHLMTLASFFLIMIVVVQVQSKGEVIKNFEILWFFVRCSSSLNTSHPLTRKRIKGII